MKSASLGTTWWLKNSCLSDDFILEDEILCLDGMVGEEFFQLKERMEPFSGACENRRTVLQYGKGRFFPFSRRLADANGAFVGACLQSEGWGKHIDIDRVRAYVEIVNRL